MSSSVQVQIVVDAVSPAVLAEFWSVALGYQLDDPPPGFESWPEALAASDIPPERWDDASAIVDPHGSSTMSGQHPWAWRRRIPRRTPWERARAETAVSRRPSCTAAGW